MNLCEIRKKIDELNISTEEVKKEAGMMFRKFREQDEGCTQEAIVAELLGNDYPSVTTRTVSRWERDGIPVENIPMIAKCLNRPVSDFLPSLFHVNPDATISIESLEIDMSSGNNLDAFAFNKSAQRNRIAVVSVVGVLTLVLMVGFFFLGKQPKIEIIWPIRRIETNQADVMGQLAGRYSQQYQYIGIQLWVHPLDGTDTYWLNSATTATVHEDGKWYQSCRFGDEDVRSMKKPPPIDFEVYAVALKKGVHFPAEGGGNYISAANDADFINKIEPYVESISSKFLITRENNTHVPPPIVLSVTSPVKITWQEQVPMYLQIYHGGEVVLEGSYNSGDAVDLKASAILYEIKMSREKDFPQYSQWVLVEASLANVSD